MGMKTELKKLADKWNDEALAWREAAKMARESNPTISARNYARAHTLEACLDELELLILHHEKP
jgi:hypothetical protein